MVIIYCVVWKDYKQDMKWVFARQIEKVEVLPMSTGQPELLMTLQRALSPCPEALWPHLISILQWHYSFSNTITHSLTLFCCFDVYHRFLFQKLFTNT